MAVDGVKNKDVQRPPNDLKPIVDEFHAREMELKKHYEKQVRALQERHQQSIEKLQKENESSFKNFTNEAQEKLTEKDLKNRDQIAEMNRVHRNQLRKNAEEFDKRSAASRQQALSSMASVEDAKDSQYEDMKKNMETYIRQQQKDFKDALVKNRDDTLESIAKERNQLQDSHATHTRMLERENRNDIARIQAEKETQRRQKDSQIRFLKDQNWVAKSDIRDKYDTIIENLNETSGRQDRMQKEQYDENLDLMRHETHQMREQQLEGFDKALSDLRNQTNERTINQINKLERDIVKQRNAHTERSVREKSQQRKEHELYMKQLTDRQNLLFKQRDEAIADTNQKHAVTLQELNRKNSNLLERHATEYLQKMRAEEIINEQKRMDAVGQVKDELLQKETKHKVDFQREKAIHNVSRRDVEDHYKEMLEKMRKTHAEHVLDLKAQNMREQNAAINQMSRALKETENKNESRIQQQAANYDEKILLVEADKRNGVARERDIAAQRAKATERYHLLQMKTQEIQFQNQIAQLKEKYEYQIENLRKQIEKMHYDQIRTKT